MTVSAAELDTCRANLDVGARAASHGARCGRDDHPDAGPGAVLLLHRLFLDALPAGTNSCGAHPRSASRRSRSGRARAAERAGSAAGPRREQAHWGCPDRARGLHPVLPRRSRGARSANIAALRGGNPFDVLCEIMIADRLLTGFGRVPRDSERGGLGGQARGVDRRPGGRRRVGRRRAPRRAGHLNYPTWLLEEAVRKHGVC